MNNRTRTLVRSAAIGVSATLAGTLMLTGPAYAAVGVDTTALRDAVTVDGVIDHLEAFQAIADANGGNRAAGTPGHEASLDYVRGLLDAAGYDTWTQEFTYERSS
ncbi:MAG TPA: aminopeptidase, partial [Microbacterium sp.]|nr:aminopeptidase [Microbacterium sp.]